MKITLRCDPDRIRKCLQSKHSIQEVRVGDIWSDDTVQAVNLIIGLLNLSSVIRAVKSSPGSRLYGDVSFTVKAVSREIAAADFAKAIRLLQEEILK